MKAKLFGFTVGMAGLLCLPCIAPAQNAGTTVVRLLEGHLKLEVYTNINGIKVADLTTAAKFPEHPDIVSWVNEFGIPPNNGDLNNYGARLSGFILPPVSGEYVFYLSSDDEGMLFLSTDESRSNRVQIAWEPAWSMPRTWTGASSGRTNNENISPPIRLEAGRKYYVESLMKEGGGGDSLGVAWKIPGGETPLDGSPPIEGRFLATYMTVVTSNVVTVAVTDEAGSEMSPMLPAFDTAAFAIRRSGPTNEALPVFYSLSGTATPGVDYEQLPGWTTIPAGAASVEVLVYPLDDLIYEPTEKVTLTIEPSPISAAYGFYAIGTPASASVFIRDNDPPPLPQPLPLVPTGAVWKYFARNTAPADGWKSPDFNDAEWFTGPAQLGYGDGDEATVLSPSSSGAYPLTAYFRHAFELTSLSGVTNLILGLLRDDGAAVYLNGMEIRRDNLPAGDLTYQTLALSAVGGTDENTFFSNSVPVAPLRLGRNVVAVEVHQSSVASTDLSFDLSLTALGGTAVTNELPKVTVVATDNSAREISPLLDVIPDTGLITFVRQGNTNQTLTVSYFIQGTASNGVDYDLIDSRITIPAGQREATLQIVPLDDEIYEGDETVQISLYPTRCCYQLGDQTNAVVTIHDDEPEPPRLPVVSVIATDPEAAEPNPVPPVMGMPTVLNMGAFTISRTGPTDNPLHVFFNIVSNSPNSEPQITNLAINGVDYELIESPVVIPAGATSVVVQVIPIDDNIIEPTEIVWLRLFVPISFAPTYSLGKQDSASVSILDNDTPTPPVVTIRATDPEAVEPNPLAAGPAVNTGQFTVYRTGPTNEPLSVGFDIGGTAGNGADYVRIPTYITIPAGAASAPIIITPLGDELKEGTETVRLSIPVPPVPMIYPTPPPAYWPGEPASAEVRIFDYQPPTNQLPVIWVVATDPQAAEPDPVSPDSDGPSIVNTGTFTIYRHGPTNEPLEVHFFIASNTVAGTSWPSEYALNGVDFELIESPVTIPAGATSVVIRVVPLDDKEIELNEIVHLELFEPTTFAPVYTIGEKRSARVTILDNDLLPPPVVTIRATDPEAVEPNPLAMNPAVNTGEFTLYRTGPTNEALTVGLVISGTASNGEDYVRLPRTITIPAGAHSARMLVTPFGDNLLEGTETVHVRIDPVEVIALAIWPPIQPPYEPGIPASAEVRIFDYQPDNHPPFVALVSPPNGAQFTAPANILLRAESKDLEGPIALLEFFAGNQLLGALAGPTTSGSFSMVWSNVAPGEYRLTARATDSDGLMSTSAPVNITVRERTAQVIRVLPPGYAPGVKLPVALKATPNSQVLSWAVEDQPPAGWIVSDISHGGQFDANFGKVKFGPFLDNQPRTLTYAVTPPENAAGFYEFNGTASFDGVSQAIGGARVIGLRMHPADANPADWRITMNELTAYSTAWLQGTSNYTTSGNNGATTLAPVPISFVTRAGLLWRGGEFYTLDPAILEPPLCWVNLPAVQIQMAGAETGGSADGGTTETCPAQSTMPANYVGGQAITVSLTIQPRTATQAYAVEEMVPAGWVVSAISDNGVFHAASRKIRWGLFLDATARTLTYTITPALASDGVRTFQGVASFDGINVPIAGRRIISPAGTTPPTTINSAERDASGVPTFSFIGETGQTYVIEYSTDLKTWYPLKTITNTTGIMVQTETDALTREQRYYRVRLAP